MGNKSKQRALSWRQVKQKFPERFLHKPPFALAPKKLVEHPFETNIVPFEPRAKSPARERATDRIDARRARRGPQTRREKRALKFQGKF